MMSSPNVTPIRRQCLEWTCASQSNCVCGFQIAPDRSCLFWSYPMRYALCAMRAFGNYPLRLTPYDLRQEIYAMRYLSSVVPQGGTKDGCVMRTFQRLRLRRVTGAGRRRNPIVLFGFNCQVVFEPTLSPPYFSIWACSAPTDQDMRTASQIMCRPPPWGPRARTQTSVTSKPTRHRRLAKARSGLADHTANTPAGLSAA
jgi:hypothetical protein